MRKYYLLSTLALMVLLGGSSYAQDFSNKGKDFWVAYGYHERMTTAGSNSQDMVLYFATDQVTNITISIPSLGYTQNLTSPAGNNVLTSAAIPKTGAQDARLLVEGTSNKGIHITSNKPMVAYAHIYNGSCSGATILFPTNTLGKEYFSINYKNVSNFNNANCWFYVIATDTGTTRVEIIPSAATTGGWAAGSVNTITLTQGQVYNVMGTFTNSPPANPANGVDLTGSKITSIATANGGCKRIAVYSGTGRISITCNNNSSSSDNYMVQAFPKTAWGKKYLTAPAAGNQSYNIYRVCVADPTTVVKINGVVTALPLLGNFYYEIAATNQPQLIEADKPITVSQYFTSQGACNNGGQPGDPEVIYLSPVEQNINKVLWNATPNFLITNHYFNVVIPNSGTAVSSFRLDGAVPAGAFAAHPQDPGYVYLRQSVSSGFHYIQSDSGFNSIAYGFGNAESYGYNGGTNIRDLFQFIQLINPYGTVPFPATCRGTPFNFAMVFPYRPIQIQWIFGASLNAMGINDTTIYNGGAPIIEDSTWVVAGRTLYRYKLPRTYFITAVGTYPIKVIATNPTPDGCGNEQIIDFDVQVLDPPVADFNFATDGCVTNPVLFTDNSNTGGRPIIRRYWDFGDATNSNLAAPSHLYGAPGTYNVKYTLVTDVGCLADTVIHPVTLNNPPVANFTVSAPLCPNVPVAFTDFSTATGGGIINQWTWNFGDGSPPVVVVAPNPPNQVHTYALPGTYNATLVVQTTTGCASTVYTMPVVIAPDGTITLTSAPGTNNQTVCINTPITNITYAIGGSSNGGSVSGLPAGVTGTFTGGVITITGTPTVSGVFNYTVTTTGPCVNPTATGTITVTADGTITLTSAAGTDNQTICINTPIIAITYAVGGSGTGGSVSGLPAGVTGSFAGGVITISGTPTVSGTFNYTVNTTGPCVNPTASGTITVTADGTITLTSAPGTNNQTVCINTPIVNITYAVGGSGTGGSVSGLPAGVTGSFAGGVITITGTPSVSGVFNYTVTTTGPCVNPTAGGTITVTADGTVTLTSAPGTDNQTVCINTPIVAITYAVGGSGTGGNVSGLPAGVTGTFGGGVITIAGSPTVSGTFNYTVNTTGPCVTPSVAGTIIVTPDGTITLTSAPGTNNQTVCINTPIINITYAVGASGNGGSVSGLPAGVTGSFAVGVITITGTPTVSGVFNYTVSTTGPCVNPTATGTITVTQDGTITLTSAPGTNNQAVCLNSAITNITYAVGGSGTGGSVSGLPAGVAGTFAGGIITISGAPSVSGTFNYTVTTTGPCVTPTATGTILVRPLPVSNFTFTTPSCETRTICFTDISVPNAGSITGWLWDFGDGSTSSQQNPCHTFATAGTYNVTLVVTTNFGCVSINPAQQVIINARPLAGYIIPEVCLNDTYAQFTDTSKVAAPDLISAWLWNFGDPPSGAANTSTLQNPQHSYSATGSYNVQLIVTSNRGCKDTITQVLFVNGSFPVADFTVVNPTTLCANDSVSIMEASTVFPGSITKVEMWFDNVAAGPPGPPDIIDNFPVTGKIYKHLYPNFQAPLTKTYTIRYRAYSGGVCQNEKLRNITINAAPKVQFNAMPNICYDAAPYQIPPAIASETGGVPGNGIFTGTGVSLTGLFSPAVAGPGTHRILYTFTSTAGGCIDTASNTITVWDTASARIDVQPLACEKTIVSFTSTNSTIPPGNGNITGWTWNFGDPASGALNTSNLQNPSHAFSGWGNYTVSLFVTTSNGCRSTLRTIPVFVNPQPKPNFRTPPSSCLPNASVSFTNLSTIADGTQASFSYLWNFGDPGSGTNNTSTLANPSHIYTGTGPFNVNLQITSGAGCVHDTTINLNTVHPQPLASFTVDKTDVCIGSGILFTNTSNPMDGTITQYNWSMDDGNVRTLPTFTYTYNTVGTYNVSLFIFNSNGCRSTTFSQTVFVNPYPPANAGPDKFMLEGGQVTLTPVLNASMPVTYLWTPPEYLSDPTIAFTIARPPDDKTYTLKVTTNKGCSATDQVFIKVLKAPAIPNIFSPNGDGIHDTWVIQYLESYPGCTVDIFNRYGQKIYHSDGYGKSWDGTVNGNPVPVGTYYYIVNPKNGRKIMSGYVDVIR